MATVEMTFTPLPAHVRTARLVATAVARRSDVAEALLDEVRLAVGEACSRAVEVHQEHCPDEPVRVTLTGFGGRFEVVVTNHAAEDGLDRAAVPAQAVLAREGEVLAGAVAPGRLGPAGGGSHSPDPAGTGLPTAIPQELGLAVIAGLADDVEVSRTETGFSIRMSWPTGETVG
jgi:serine/threonine-protein kinase RsbW